MWPNDKNAATVWSQMRQDDIVAPPRERPCEERSKYAVGERVFRTSKMLYFLPAVFDVVPMSS
jgi:hypothetical protein